MTKIFLGSIFKGLTNNESNIEIEYVGTVGNLIQFLDSKYNGFTKRLLNNGKPGKFVNIYVDGEDIRFKDMLNTRVTNESTIDIIPAVAGG